MKKFTRNFLGGGYSRSLRILRSFALSLVALVGLHVTAFGQTCSPPPGTVQIIAEDITPCYNGDNTYKVDLSVVGFRNVDSLDLVLNFNGALWTLDDVDIIASAFLKSETNTTVTPPAVNVPMVSTIGANSVRFQWAENIGRGIINNGAETVWATLTFSIKNFPNNTLPTYSTTLNWGASSFVGYCVNGTGAIPVPSKILDNGSITATKSTFGVVVNVDPTTVPCTGMKAVATVTSPVGAGYSYSFNGVDSWADYEDNGNVADVYPGNHTVYVQDMNGCLVKKDFSLATEGEVTHSTGIENEACDHLGEVTLTVSNTNVAVAGYWVVPDAVYKAGSAPYPSTYKSNNNKTLVPSGSYWTAVETECGLTDWDSVYVEKGAQFDWEGGVTVPQASCGMGGEYSVAVIDSLTDSTSIHIEILKIIDAVSVSMVADTIFATTEDLVNDTIVFTDLEAGTYEISLSDGGDCSYSASFQILPADQVTFNIAHTDVACSDTSGTMWVTSVSGVNVSALTDTFGLYIEGTYYDDMAVKQTVYDTIWNVSTDTLTHLFPGVYQAWLFQNMDNTINCPVAFKGINGNEITIFDNGTVTFTPNVSDVTCYGDDNGKIWITNVDRNCEVCNGDPYYMAQITGTDTTIAWLPLANVDDQAGTAFSGLPAGDYLVEVNDTTDQGDCISSKVVTIVAPDSLYFTVDSVYAPTCYYGNDGSVRVVIEGGIAPYKYAINHAPDYTNGTAFNLEQGQSYYLEVIDKNGCTFGDSIHVPELSEFLISAEIVEGGDACTRLVDTVIISLDTFTHYDSGIEYYGVKAPMISSVDPMDIRNAAGAVKFGADDVNNKVFNSSNNGIWYFYAIDPFGCVAVTGPYTIDIVDPLPLQIESVVTTDAACDGTWSGSLTITIVDGTGVLDAVDSVFYYRWANNPDVLEADPTGIYNPWRAFNYDAANETSEYTANAAMTAGKWYLQVKDACKTVTYDKNPIIIDDWGPIEWITQPEALNVTCNGGHDGKIVIEDSAVQGGKGEPYVYTLITSANVPYMYNGSSAAYIKKELISPKAFTNVVAGEYRVIVYDQFNLSQFPEMCPPDTSDVIYVAEPCELMFTTDVKHVSCAGAEDAEVTLYISGGIGGTYGYPETFEGECRDSLPNTTDGNHYYVTVNNLTNPGNSFTRMIADGIDTLIFQTSGGEYDIFVTDELNKNTQKCYAEENVKVYEPQPWAFTPIYTHPSDCDTADGKIQVVITGGFEFNTGNPLDSIDSWYYIDAISNSNDTLSLWGGYGDTITISQTASYGDSYTLYVWNDPDALNQIAMYDMEEEEPYFDITLSKDQCYGKTQLTLENFIPFDLDIEAGCVRCNGEDNGSVTISNITGGFANAYQLQFVSVDSVYDPAYDSDKWWAPATDADGWISPGETVTYDMLGAGDYYVFIKDSSGYTLQKCCRPFPFAICDRPELVLDSVVRISNTICANDSTGSFEIFAHGGTPPYKYWYTRQDLYASDFVYPGIPDHSLFISNSVMTGLPSGAYVGWVMDSLGCVIGCDVDETGLPKDGQRVVINDAGQLMYDDYTILGGGCYLNPVDVVYHNITGGSGDSITVVLEGKAIVLESGDVDADTTTVDTTMTYTFAYVEGSDITLTNVIPGDYMVHVETNMNCPTTGDELVIDPGTRFVVELVPTGGKGCPGDNAVWVEIKTDGGVAPYKYVIYREDGTTLVRDTTTIVDQHLSVGRNYIVHAIDAGGCVVVSAPLELLIPQPVDFTVKDVTCFGEAKASARVYVTGTEGRLFDIHWKEIETGANGVINDVATDTIIRNVFAYDEKNVTDRHYQIFVTDDSNCPSRIDTLTFHKVDGPLQVVDVVQNVGDCNSTLDFEVAGGTAPYTVLVDGNIEKTGFVQTEQVNLILGGGDHEIEVIDDNECSLVKTYTFNYNVIMDTTFNIYSGDTVSYVNTEAGLDTMLTGGSYTYHYTNAGGCSVELNIDVVERDRTAPVLASVSPTDTIVDNHPIFVMNFEDAVSFNESGYLTVFAEGADTTALKLMLTQDMFGDSSITVTYDYLVSGGLDKNTTYIVNVDSGIVMGDGLVWNGIMDETTWTFTTGADFATGIDPGVETVDFKVYPNPFKGFIRIDNAEKLTRVVVSNIAGQRVMDIENPTYEIRTGNLVTGVYVVTLISNDEIVKSERIIKR
ncbi:MAG: T9SS type A sorting domain-containing protein [Draconibacterium sp.]